MAVVFERSLHGGTQVVHRFANGLGASVVQHGFSYGGGSGLKELAVIRFLGEDNSFDLNYSTPITDDVLGHLTEEDVADLLVRIENLVWEV